MYSDLDVEAGFSCQLQTETQKLMDGLDEGTREKAFGNREWASHVTREGDNDRPEVEERVRIEYRPRRVDKADDGTFAPSPHLPVEVKTIIYSLAELQSVVSLRQADKSWYYAFQQLERLWKTFMRLRNPWIRLESCNVSFWADFVLCSLPDWGHGRQSIIMMISRSPTLPQSQKQLLVFLYPPPRPSPLHLNLSVLINLVICVFLNCVNTFIRVSIKNSSTLGQAILCPNKSTILSLTISDQGFSATSTRLELKTSSATHILTERTTHHMSFWDGKVLY